MAAVSVSHVNTDTDRLSHHELAEFNSTKAKPKFDDQDFLRKAAQLRENYPGFSWN